MPKRIQMSRQHPWRADHPDAVIVARPSKWGNPYTIKMMQEQIDRVSKELGIADSSLSARGMAVEAFRCDLKYGPDSAWWWPGPHMGILTILGALEELRGKDLACWCPLDQPCHTDVLLELANGGRS